MKAASTLALARYLIQTRRRKEEIASFPTKLNVAVPKICLTK